MVRRRINLAGKSKSGGDGGGSTGGSSGSGTEQNRSSTQGQGGENNETVNIYEMKTTSILTDTDENSNWENIKSEVEFLYSTWDTIILDLYKLNIPAENVGEFSNALNKVTVNVKNEDRVASLNTLANLYGYLPGYMEYSVDSNEEVNIKNTKYHILNAFSLVETDNWDGISSEVNSAIDSFMPVISNLDYIKGKDHSINRIYIILNELKNSLQYADKDIFYINYKNLMNELNIFG